jgi:hypothetical protein
MVLGDQFGDEAGVVKTMMQGMNFLAVSRGPLNVTTLVTPNQTLVPPRCSKLLRATRLFESYDAVLRNAAL